MPKTVSIGANGPVVQTLQGALNGSPPTTLALLAVDGIFGSKTSARVREFQSQHRLAVDGIVGPMTWGTLLLPVDRVPPQSGCDCGNVQSGSQGLGNLIKHEFLRSRGGESGPAPPPRSFAATGVRSLVGQMGVGGTATGGQTSLGLSGSPFRQLDAGQLAKARAVYGDSLDFDRIFISNKAGLQNRAFTIAFPDKNQIVQIINCGTFTPSDGTLIHELAHVWQSQHHSDPFHFMVNAVDCQAGAVVANGAEVFSDPDVLLHKDHPVQFPFSAYAYMPGFGLSSYAAEQMANAIEHGDKTLVAHVKSIPKNAIDGDNIAALKLTQFSDRRLKGVVF